MIIRKHVGRVRSNRMVSKTMLVRLSNLTLFDKYKEYWAQEVETRLVGKRAVGARGLTRENLLQVSLF